MKPPFSETLASIANPSNDMSTGAEGPSPVSRRLRGAGASFFFGDAFFGVALAAFCGDDSGVSAFLGF